MIADWLLLTLRLIAPIILYAFLGTMVYHLWKPAAVRASARLVALDDAAQTWPLRADATIGRDAANTIAVHDDFVSARHARVSFRDGAWWLADAGSTNGTTLNAMPMAAETTLNVGDVIGVGNHFFRFETQE